MMYQTLHTPPITPEELCRLETLYCIIEVVKIKKRFYDHCLHILGVALSSI